jgi:hypothetical protein
VSELHLKWKGGKNRHGHRDLLGKLLIAEKGLSHKEINFAQAREGQRNPECNLTRDWHCSLVTYGLVGGSGGC